MTQVPQQGEQSRERSVADPCPLPNITSGMSTEEGVQELNRYVGEVFPMLFKSLRELGESLDRLQQRAAEKKRQRERRAVEGGAQ